MAFARAMAVFIISSLSFISELRSSSFFRLTFPGRQEAMEKSSTNLFTW
jgi:hypothetical protein